MKLLESDVALITILTLLLLSLVKFQDALRDTPAEAVSRTADVTEWVP